MSCQNPEQKINNGNEIPSDLKQSIINVEVLNGTQKNSYTFSDQLGYKEFQINNNQFSFSVNISEPQISKLSIEMNANINFFIEPGDTLNLKFAEEDIYNNFGFEFNGKNSHINNLIGKIDKTLKHQNTSFNHFFNCEPSIFIQKMDSLKRVCSNYFESFVNHSEFKISENNLDLIKSYINYKIGWYYSIYPIKYEYVFNNGKLEVQEINRKLASEVIITTKKTLNNISYLEYINAEVYKTTNFIFQREDYNRRTNIFPDLDLYFYVIDSLTSNNLEQAYLKFNRLQYAFFMRDQSFSKYSTRFIKEYPQSKYEETITQLELDLKESILNKEVINKYSFYDINNKKRNLSEFKGKVIYIDFWATWCGPCIDQMKYLNEVAKQFNKEDNLKILCISLDKRNNFQKWGKTIQIEEMKGEHWMAENAFKSDVCKDFRILGIPRYILFDKKGNLFDANAIAPSDDRIIKVLNKLVNE